MDESPIISLAPFPDYTVNSEAQYFADQTGVFEIQQFGNDGNKVMRQVKKASTMFKKKIVCVRFCRQSHLVPSLGAKIPVLPSPSLETIHGDTSHTHTHTNAQTNKQTNKHLQLQDVCEFQRDGEVGGRQHGCLCGRGCDKGRL